MSLFEKKKPSEAIVHVKRIRGVVEANLPELYEDDYDLFISVNELACMEPGCPPKETVVSLMTKTAPLKFKLLKAMTDITDDEVLVLGALKQGVWRSLTQQLVPRR